MYVCTCPSRSGMLLRVVASNNRPPAIYHVKTTRTHVDKVYEIQEWNQNKKNFENDYFPILGI